MEKSAKVSKQSSFQLSALVGFMLFDRFSRWVNGAQCVLVTFWSLLYSHTVYGSSKIWDSDQKTDFKLSNQQSPIKEKKDSRDLWREDAEMVMKSLGLFCDAESEEVEESYSSDELSGLFEEQEPSLEEVKQAFDVFDENRDGFIDARELQRILCILGLKEGADLKNCREMIKSSDENQDGRIDFHEFVKFLENNSC